MADEATRRREAASFFRTLTQDDRGSTYVVARAGGGEWREAPLRAGDPLPDVCDGGAWFVTRNGFFGGRRRVESCRQANALMFDVDCHGEGFEASLPPALEALQASFDAGALPRPTMVVDSGRGIHLYYVLASSTPARVRGGAVNARGLAYVGDVQRGLGRRVAEVLSGVGGASVDESVYDLARVGRIPGSWNERAQRYCRLLVDGGPTYSLSELKPFCDVPERRRARGREPRGGGRAEGILFDRLAKISELQALRGFGGEGSREGMCFCYYNAATQLFGPEEAMRLTRSLNARFSHPLPDPEVEHIARSVDSNVVAFGGQAGQVGFYPMSARTLSERLALTPDEIHALCMFSSKKERDRVAAKAATREARKRRDAAIERLYDTGGMTQAEVAKAVGCSLRTVASVLKKARCDGRDGHACGCANSCPTGLSGMPLATDAPRKAPDGETDGVRNAAVHSHGQHGHPRPRPRREEAVEGCCTRGASSGNGLRRGPYGRDDARSVAALRYIRVRGRSSATAAPLQRDPYNRNMVGNGEAMEGAGPCS